jgi:hypothetical protein
MASTVTSYREVASRTFWVRWWSRTRFTRCLASGLSSVYPSLRGLSRVCVRWRRGCAVAEDATDGGPEPADRPLTFEVLCGLAAVLAAIRGGREDGGIGAWQSAATRRPLSTTASATMGGRRYPYPIQKQACADRQDVAGARFELDLP